MYRSNEISFDEFRTLISIPLFGSFIVNPMGPTLMVFGIGRISDSKSNLMFASLNPFSQTAEIISEYSFDTKTVDLHKKLLKDFPIAADIEFFLSEKFDNNASFSTPTILFGTLDSQDDQSASIQREIIFNILKYSSSPSSTLSSLERFPMNVMDRVSHEMNGMFSNKNINKKICDEQELETLVAIVCNPDHIRQEFKGFLIAWNGSIDFQKGHGMGNSMDIFSLDEMIEFLSRVFPNLVKFLLK